MQLIFNLQEELQLTSVFIHNYYSFGLSRRRAVAAPKKITQEGDSWFRAESTKVNLKGEGVPWRAHLPLGDHS
jgi:hypothetical protein